MILDPKSKNNKIKVPRVLAAAIEPSATKSNRIFKKIDNYAFIPGNGSAKGNIGVTSENELARQLSLYADGYDVPDEVQDVIDALDLHPMETIAYVKSTGSQNNSRKLQTDGTYVYTGSRGDKVKAPNFNIGEILSDITILTSKGRKIYLSVKEGDHVSVANLGIKTLFNFSEDGTLLSMSDLGSALLKTLQIDPKILSASLRSYVKMGRSKATRELVKSIDVTPELQMFVNSTLGYGYWYVHKIGEKYKCLYLDRVTSEALTKIVSAKVRYPGRKAKEVSVIVKCAKCELNIRLRNTEGALTPNKFVCDLYPRF